MLISLHKQAVTTPKMQAVQAGTRTVVRNTVPNYQRILRRHGLTSTMSGKGNCHDNSAVESFFKFLKADLVWRRNRQTRREVKITIFGNIHGFRNPRRKHSALGWKSPVAFWQKAA